MFSKFGFRNAGPDANSRILAFLLVLLDSGISNEFQFLCFLFPEVGAPRVPEGPSESPGLALQRCSFEGFFGLPGFVGSPLGLFEEFWVKSRTFFGFFTRSHHNFGWPFSRVSGHGAGSQVPPPLFLGAEFLSSILLNVGFVWQHQFLPQRGYPIVRWPFWLTGCSVCSTHFPFCAAVRI